MSNEASASAGVFTVKRPKYPYPGLRPFEIEEWSIFFGRERMIDEVVERLAAHRLVMIHGSSGSGKSSLVRAGVLPKLARQHLRAGAPWRTCSIRPSNGPLWNLAKEFARLEGVSGDVNRVGEIVRKMNQREATLSAIAGSLNGLQGQRLCVLVDQFEELFRFEKESSREEAELFVDLLVRSNIQNTDRDRGSIEPTNQVTSVHVVVTMRSEFLGECARFNGLAEAVNQTQFLVPRMDRDSLLRAIRRPAQLYGGEVSLELAERLVADVAGGEDELPLIQHGLMCMWNAHLATAQPGKKIVLEAAPLEAAGGLAQLLSSHADAIVNEVAPDAERRNAVERLFRALTDLNDEGQAIRRPQSFRSLVAVTEIGDDKLRKIIDGLRRDGVSFLLPFSKEPIEEDTTIDIAHESLIRQWKTLSTWVGKEARAGREWQYLVHAAERKGLLSGPPLAEAARFRDEIKPTAAWAERYGGSFHSVSQLIKNSLTRKRRDFWLRTASVAGVLVFLVYWAYSRQQDTIHTLMLEQQRLAELARQEMEQQAAFADQNLQLAVRSAQKLLDQVAGLLGRGDITANGARGILRVAEEIVAQAHTVKPTPETADLVVKLAWTAHDIHATVGDVAEAYDRAQFARDRVQSLHGTDTDDPNVMTLLFNSIWRMGDAVADRDFGPTTQEQALELFKEAEKLARRLAEMAPEDSGRLRNLSFILLKIGNVRQVLGDWPSAIAEYSAAVKIMQGVVAGSPENRIWQRDLASALGGLGQALAGKGDLNAALNVYRAALEIRSKLATADPNHDGLQSNLATSHRDIARLYERQRNLDAALAEYRIAIGIGEYLLNKDPTNVTWEISLAPLYADVGRLLRSKGDLAGALEQYRRAFVIRRELAVKDRGNPARQRGSAMAAMALADVLVAQGQDAGIDEALKLNRDAIASLDNFRPRYDRDVFSFYIRIGDILKSRGDAKGALKEYEVASGIAREAAIKDAASATWQRSLMESYTKIGRFLIEQGRAREALEHYTKALAFVEPMAAKHPEIAGWVTAVQSLKTEIESLASKL